MCVALETDAVPSRITGHGGASLEVDDVRMFQASSLNWRIMAAAHGLMRTACAGASHAT